MEDQPDKTIDPPNTKKTQRIYALLTLFVFIALIAVVSFVTSSPNNGNGTNTSHQPPKSNRVAEVRITPTGFQPATLVVKLGTKITWTNADQALHQVASNPYPRDTDLKTLKSEILNNTQTYTYAANTAGTFGYHDQMQPTINGILVVQKQ